MSSGKSFDGLSSIGHAATKVATQVARSTANVVKKEGLPAASKMRDAIQGMGALTSRVSSGAGFTQTFSKTGTTVNFRGGAASALQKLQKLKNLPIDAKAIRASIKKHAPSSESFSDLGKTAKNFASQLTKNAGFSSGSNGEGLSVEGARKKADAFLKQAMELVGLGGSEGKSSGAVADAGQKKPSVFNLLSEQAKSLIGFLPKTGQEGHGVAPSLGARLQGRIGSMQEKMQSVPQLVSSMSASMGKQFAKLSGDSFSAKLDKFGAVASIVEDLHSSEFEPSPGTPGQQRLENMQQVLKELKTHPKFEQHANPKLQEAVGQAQVGLQYLRGMLDLFSALNRSSGQPAPVAEDQKPSETPPPLPPRPSVQAPPKPVQDAFPHDLHTALQRVKDNNEPPKALSTPSSASTSPLATGASTPGGASTVASSVAPSPVFTPSDSAMNTSQSSAAPTPQRQGSISANSTPVPATPKKTPPPPLPPRPNPTLSKPAAAAASTPQPAVKKQPPPVPKKPDHLKGNPLANRKDASLSAEDKANIENDVDAQLGDAQEKAGRLQSFEPKRNADNDKGNQQVIAAGASFAASASGGQGAAPPQPPGSDPQNGESGLGAPLPKMPSAIPPPPLPQPKSVIPPASPLPQQAKGAIPTPPPMPKPAQTSAAKPGATTTASPPVLSNGFKEELKMRAEARDKSLSRQAASKEESEATARLEQERATAAKERAASGDAPKKADTAAAALAATLAKRRKSIEGDDTPGTW